MIDVDGIRDTLKKSNIYVKENDKNFICICPYCGDHKNPAKKGHLYVSKNDIIPTCHCWYCQGAWPIQKLLFDLTGSKCDNLIQTEEYKSQNIKPTKDRFKKFKIPDLDTYNFEIKRLYITKRTFGELDLNLIPNLIFDISKFFEINNMNVHEYLRDWEFDIIQNTSVAFLSHHHTTLYCRSSNPNSNFSFRKIVLQKDPLGMLDYYCIDNGNLNSNIVVLSEGNFDILGCYAKDSLKLNNSARVYAAGCTFAYPELLKSVCFDFSIYQADVNILSDSDKKKYHYNKLINEYPYLYNSLSIYYNRYGKDFGMRNQEAVKLY